MYYNVGYEHVKVFVIWSLRKICIYKGKISMQRTNKLNMLIIFLSIITLIFGGCGRREQEVTESIEIQVNNDFVPHNDLIIEVEPQVENDSQAERDEQTEEKIVEEEGNNSNTSKETSETNGNAKNESTKTNTTSKQGERSILDFLKIAIKPVGSTMYVWGGGWNEEDTAAGIEAVTIGVSPRWAEFASVQDASYDYNDTTYQIHDGLDCSGYVGWAVYNVLETQNGQEGYVLSSSKMASNYANRGLGTYISAGNIDRWQPGDIMSMSGHVWIVVGMCEDGSVLLLHSSPPGVIFCGTNLSNGNKSQAVIRAEQIMSTYYPSWYAKYPDCARPYWYLTNSSAMRWNRETLNDNENLSSMTANEIVDLLY